MGDMGFQRLSTHKNSWNKLNLDTATSILILFSTKLMLDTVTTQPPMVGSNFQKPTIGITVMDSKEVSNSSVSGCWKPFHIRGWNRANFLCLNPSTYFRLCKNCRSSRYPIQLNSTSCAVQKTFCAVDVLCHTAHLWCAPRHHLMGSDGMAAIQYVTWTKNVENWIQD